MVGEFILPDNRIPVTVITGFLGSGKTTLLNRVLTEDHGLRIAVIENEFGEVDIDGSLVADQQNMGEDILMLNNGCLCCTVRSDLVDMLTKLAREKKGVFDHVLIETTGLANPAPIIQTFFMEQDLADNFKLDGVITVVDSKHVTPHLDEIKPDGMVNEALEQVAFADRIVLNKIDLVTDADLDDLRARLRSINTLAEIKSAVKANVEISYVMGVGGFDLEKVVDNVDSKLGVEAMPKKEGEHGHSHGTAAADEDHSDCDHDHGKCEHEGDDGHSHGAAAVEDHSNCAHDDGKCEHDHGHGHVHAHVHDDAVSSVSIVEEGELDLDRVNDWLGLLLQTRSEDIYRMKGVLAIDGAEDRFVFQGVHALFEGSPERPWREGEARISRLVFIGKDLPKEEIKESFKSCLVANIKAQANK